ncbi:MAG: ABC transporter permease [Paludibacteraceae bacterium]|jgi:lipoprotein-releasing system permease protein|nr:ABC transporter permease [Paludibacteraceae bacterium]
MKFSFFIAKHFHYNQDKTQLVSKPAVRIATTGIAVGLTVIIIAVSVIIGFKKEIQNKVIGFGSHIQISNYDRNSSFETVPITINDSLLKNLRDLPSIKQVQTFGTKPGILKTNSDFTGVIIKGVGEEYDWDFLNKSLVQGTLPTYNDSTIGNEVLISKTIANLLQLKVGDSFFTYFMQENIRVRKFVICGIYQTNISEYDKNFIIADIKQIQRLNQWDKNQVSGLEMQVHNYKKLDDAYNEVFMTTANRFDDNGSTYYIQTIRDINPQIFGWLDLLDINTWVILVLMLSVAGFNIISGLLILILERTNGIGILKALGANNWSIRKVFLFQASFLIGKGMLWGNIVGVSICLIQHFTHLIPLDADAYYISYVPVSLNVFYWLLINVGTAIISFTMLIAPSYIITRISPAKAIRFE